MSTGGARNSRSFGLVAELSRHLVRKGIATDELGRIHERIPIKTPNMNAHIEAFHSLLDEDVHAAYAAPTVNEKLAAVES